jgi:thiol-disulfide isomerase/thioredoxin
MKTTLIAFLFCLIAAGCSVHHVYQLQKDTTGKNIIIGEFPRSVLETDSTYYWFAAGYRSYETDKDIIPQIANRKNDYTFILVLGTWCSDSKRDVPKFFKVMDLAGVQENQILLFGVDRAKKGSDEITERYAVKRVPTIIMLKKGEEIGRITEMPRKTIEYDLAEMIRNDK